MNCAFKWLKEVLQAVWVKLILWNYMYYAESYKVKINEYDLFHILV